jgi:DNA-binding NtrC family response regulator
VSELSTRDPTAPRQPPEQQGAAMALVLVWSRAHPQRVGELLLVPRRPASRTLVFGRGGSRDDDGGERAFLARQRPGALSAQPPIEDDCVSRKQLALRPHDEGIAVDCLGRLPMRVDGHKVAHALVRPGETLELEGQLLFVCVPRPVAMRELCEIDAADMAPFGEPDGDGLVGEAVAAWELREHLAFVAPRAGHVLLLGESGTGKERVARAIHARSARAARPLVSRNAATLPAGLIDAELFGNAASYPHAGMAARPGLIGEADGSSLFLDEIGEMPESLQTHLLRVLDEGGEYQRLGEARRRMADLRVIAATNRPAPELKADLAARLPLHVHVPPLGERIEDVPLLVRHLMRSAAARDAHVGARFFENWDGKTGEPRLSVALARALVQHTFTTHVRELDSLLWTSLASSRADALELTDAVKRRMAPAPASPAPADITPEALRAAMAKHDGVKQRVWRELGLPSRYALHRLLKKHGIEGDD